MEINFNYSPINAKMAEFHAAPHTYKALIGGLDQGRLLVVVQKV